MDTEKDTSGAGMTAAKDFVLGAVGALAGGALGVFLFFLLVRQGFYAIILPGTLVGIGCGGLSGRKSLALGMACAALGLAGGILTEWRFAPFIQDHSLGYFLLHLHKLSRVTQALLAFGTFMAFWFGRGREGGAWFRRVRPQPPNGSPPAP